MTFDNNNREKRLREFYETSGEALNTTDKHPLPPAAIDLVGSASKIQSLPVSGPQRRAPALPAHRFLLGKFRRAATGPHDKPPSRALCRPSGAVL
jgi:hypothetical protein